MILSHILDLLLKLSETSWAWSFSVYEIFILRNFQPHKMTAYELRLKRCSDQYSKLFNNCLTLFVYILSFIALFFYDHFHCIDCDVGTLHIHYIFQTNYLLVFFIINHVLLYSESECIFHSIIWSARVWKCATFRSAQAVEIFSLGIRTNRVKTL